MSSKKYLLVLDTQMISSQWQKYKYHNNRLPGQDNPKYNFRKYGCNPK